MKRYAYLFAIIAFLFSAICSTAQTGYVGINTNNPVTGLHVQDSGVLFHHGFYLLENMPAIDNALPPVSGAGARVMWFPYRKAFRAGQVDGTQWDRNSTGNLSFATGINNTAQGRLSSVFGRNNTANSDVSFVVGQFNDPILSAGTNTGTSFMVLPTYPLFIIGNGDGTGSLSNAMIVRKDGRVGIGTNVPTDRLHVNAGSAEDAFHVQVNSNTKLRVWNNGGTSIGALSSPPVNGLIVSGPVQPQNGISTPAKLVVESTGDSIFLKSGSSEVIVANNGNIIIRTNGRAKIEVLANGNIQMNGNNITIAALGNLNLNGTIVRLNNGSTPVAKLGSISTVSGPTATITSNTSPSVFAQ